ncbi:hypothetical protein JCM8097_006175 [Rhodosporidiobolus ruineniae]
MANALRANTHKERPPSWTASPFSYRHFQRLKYQPWLKRSYADTVKPFYLEQDAHYAFYTTDFSANIRTANIEVLGELVCGDLPRIVVDEEYNNHFFPAWQGASVRTREDWCLTVWERQHRFSEQSKLFFGQVECPELTLEWASDPYNFHILLSALLFDPAKETYRHVPHPQWDRLNNWSTTLATPPSRGVRAFTEEGKIMRAVFLAHFAADLVRVVLDKPYIKPSLIQGGARLPSADRAELLENGTMSVLPRGGAKSCLNCHRRDVSLTCCSKCKNAADTLIYYCSRECAVSHWPEHRLRCGKRPTAVEAALTDATARGPAPYTLRQQTNLRYLKQFPRVIWGCENRSPNGSVANISDPIFFFLPPFVRPFLPTREAVVALRFRAIKHKSPLDIGILAYLILLANGLQNLLPPDEHDPVLQLLANVLDIEVAELWRGAREAKERFAGAEKAEGLDELVVGAIKQMGSGTADTSLPNQHLLPSSFLLFDAILNTPDYFFALPFPPDPASTSKPPIPRTGTVHVDDDTPSCDRVSPLLRQLSLRIFLTAGEDKRALGVVTLCLLSVMGLERDSLGARDEEENPPGRQTGANLQGEQLTREEVTAIIEEYLQLESGAVEEAIEVVEKELSRGEEPEGQDEGDEVREENELIRVAVEHFRATVRGRQALDEGEAAKAGAKKKKNKKKKKKNSQQAE